MLEKICRVECILAYHHYIPQNMPHHHLADEYVAGLIRSKIDKKAADRCDRAKDFGLGIALFILSFAIVILFAALTAILRIPSPWWSTVVGFANLAAMVAAISAGYFVWRGRAVFGTLVCGK